MKKNRYVKETFEKGKVVLNIENLINCDIRINGILCGEIKNQVLKTFQKEEDVNMGDIEIQLESSEVQFGVRNLGNSLFGESHIGNSL